MHATTIIGYQFAADLFCPEHIIQVLPTHEGGQFDGWGLGKGVSMSVEDNLDEIAAAFGIDRYSESSFDSDDFPKVVFGDYDGHGQCGVCGAYISGNPPEDENSEYEPLGGALGEDQYFYVGVAGYGGSISQLVGERGGKLYLINGDTRMVATVIEAILDGEEDVILYSEAWAVSPLPDDFTDYYQPEDMNR